MHCLLATEKAGYGLRVTGCEFKVAGFKANYSLLIAVHQNFTTYYALPTGY
jgi:hypothetical protein